MFEFGEAFLEIYSAKLELKLEHYGSHATFIDLDIPIDKAKLIYTMFDKRDTFNFHIVRIQLTYHLSFFIVPLCQIL